MLENIETTLALVIAHLVLIFAFGALVLNLERQDRRRKEKYGKKRRICKMHRRAELQDDVAEGDRK